MHFQKYQTCTLYSSGMMAHYQNIRLPLCDIRFNTQFWHKKIGLKLAPPCLPSFKYLLSSPRLYPHFHLDKFFKIRHCPTVRCFSENWAFDGKKPSSTQMIFFFEYFEASSFIEKNHEKSFWAYFSSLFQKDLLNALWYVLFTTYLPITFECQLCNSIFN